MCCALSMRCSPSTFHVYINVTCCHLCGRHMNDATLSVTPIESVCWRYCNRFVYNMLIEGNDFTHQDEYIMLTVLPLSRVLPRVEGTCGHFYAVEHLVPFRMKASYMNLRAKILVHLMGTLKLFYEFLNEPLQWCDVRFDNFGLSAEHPKRYACAFVTHASRCRFMIMDADYLFTESRLNRLYSDLRCRADDDCRIIDCVSTCNSTTQRCMSRSNDNVDVSSSLSLRIHTTTECRSSAASSSTRCSLRIGFIRTTSTLLPVRTRG